MKKSVWITMLEKNEGLGRTIYQEMSRYGLEPGGHFWVNDLANMAWAGTVPELSRAHCRAWIIVGQASSFADPVTRQGLALLALAAQAEHGVDFPILLSVAGGQVAVEELPTPLRGAEAVSSGLGVKAVARANAGRGRDGREYRLAVHPLPGLGLWFELGPARDPWLGAFLGCAGAPATVPDAHGVGPAGAIPRNSTLNFPVCGLKMALNNREFIAWGVHNQLSPAESYFVRVAGTPESLVFGPFPDHDDAEVFSTTLL